VKNPRLSFVVISVIFQSCRGQENEPRDVALHLIRSIRSEPLMSIGAGFGLNRYSAVTRVRSRLKKDKRFRDRLQQIERSILKGQTQT